MDPVIPEQVKIVEFEKSPGSIEETEETELSKAELARQMNDDLTESALESDFTRAQRKAVTTQKKSGKRARMKNKAPKRANRNRAGVTYR